MESHYTHTTWRVKPGREDEFIRRWSEWPAPALLLRDLERAETFVSFGPWESAAVVRNWRALEGYQQRVVRLREVVDAFEPRTLEVTAAAVGHCCNPC